MKLTKAQIAALQAVKNGRVFREYRRDGNKLYSLSGNGAKALWALDKMKLIRDGEDKNAGVVITTKQVLTKAGEDALHTATWS